MRCILLVLLLFASSLVWGQSLSGVTLLGKSLSGRSIIINRGSFEGVRRGDKATFSVQTGIELPQLTRVGRGEAVKVFPKFSYWFLRDTELVRDLKKDEELVVAFDDDVLAGMSPLRVQKKKKVHPNLKTKELTSKRIPDKFKKKSLSYKKSAKLVKTEPSERVDIFDETDLMWDEQANRYVEDEQEEIEALYVMDDKSSTKGNREVDKFEREFIDELIEGSEENVNSQKVGLHSFYEENVRDSDNKSLRDDVSFLNVTEEYKAKKNREVYFSPRAVEKIRAEEEMWSRDLSDEELRQYMVDSGIVHEVNRRVHALENKSGNELLLRYTFDMTDNSTQDDPENRNISYSLALGYEYHLMRASRNLKRYTVDFIFQNANDYYNVAEGGNENAKSSEVSFKSSLNYYLYNFPSSIRKFIWYGGAGIRAGNAVMSNPNFQKDYLFQLRSMPSLHFGMKYRFSGGDEKNEIVKIGYGVNMLLIAESTQFKIKDTIVSGDVIEQDFTINDTRFSIGLSVYF